MKTRPFEERFWAKVEVRGPDDCWEWTATKVGNGYGQISRGGRVVSAHRVSWELQFGPIPEGLCILHHCDHPSCVNPTHLFLGTHADNARDRDKKGRDNQANKARGEDQWNSKLTEKNVHQTRRWLAEGWTHRNIAEVLGVSRRAISYINTGETWAWLK